MPLQSPAPENESDYAHPPAGPVTTTPPAAKISREHWYGFALCLCVLVVGAGLLTGRVSEALVAFTLGNIIGGILGRSKPEGVVGEQTLKELFRARG